MPAKAVDRIKSAMKKFQPIVAAAKAKDVNESDTVTIITDMLECVFGFDKFKEITSEHAIRGTFCDLAVEIDGDLSFLIEIKAIGLELKDQHVKQAVDYASNKGADWVILTNAVEWRIYKVIFGKPIDAELTETLHTLEFSPKNAEHLQNWCLLAKEGMKKDNLEKHYTVKQLLNRFTVGAVLLSDPVVSVVKRELKRLSADIKVTEDDVRELLQNEVIKREVFEGEKAAKAGKLVARSESKSLRKVKESAQKNTAVNDAIAVVKSAVSA